RPRGAAGGERGQGRPRAAGAGARARRPACRARRPRGAAAGRGGTNGDRPRHGGDRRARGVGVSGVLLLAVDGDSLAHRAYHAIPKSIRGNGRPANALVGFGNFLRQLWDGERPESVLVGWDSLETPTYRHVELPGYQAGREFESAILEQLGKLPDLTRSFGFAVGKAPGYEADDFLAAAAAAW